MIDQLIQLAKEYVTPLVQQNAALDNAQIDGVSAAAGSSLIDGLKGAVANGNVQDIVALFQNGDVKSNAVTQQIIDLFQSNLGSKLGIQGGEAQGLSASLIPNLLEAVVGKSKAGESGFDLSGLMQAIGGGQSGGLMDLVSKYGGQFGLDQNGDGKIDLNDAISAMSGGDGKANGGLGGLLGKFFGK